MVELHEPQRVLVLLEARAEHIVALVRGNRRLTRLVAGEWMRLGRIDPDSGAIELWTGARFEAWRAAWPQAPASEPGGLPAILDWNSDRLIGVRS
jgi:uncharacterized protein YbcC (UPF0753/DUF2309 family)